jgi:hypothetical protein
MVWCWFFSGCLFSRNPTSALPFKRGGSKILLKTNKTPVLEAYLPFLKWGVGGNLVKLGVLRWRFLPFSLFRARPGRVSRGGKSIIKIG